MGYRVALGSVASTAQQASSAAGLAVSALTNPYVPEVLCRLQQLQAVNTGKPAPSCPTTPRVSDSLGIGKFMPIARTYVYAEQHPWAYPLIASLIVGVPFLVGYVVGRSK